MSSQDRTAREPAGSAHGPAIVLFAVALNSLALAAGSVRFFGAGAPNVAATAVRFGVGVLAVGGGCLGWYAWRRAVPQFLGMMLSWLVSAPLVLLGWAVSGALGALSSL